MKDICGNCKYLNEDKKMINDSYICNFHLYTTKPENMGCYKIQFSKKNQ